MEVTDNLLENAVRYAQKSIALQIKKKDGFLMISVEDDGIGFVDTEEKVTEPLDVYKRQIPELKTTSAVPMDLEMTSSSRAIRHSAAYIPACMQSMETIRSSNARPRLP